MLKSPAMKSNLTSASLLVATAVLAACFLPSIEAKSEDLENKKETSSAESLSRLHLSQKEAAEIGNRVWRNECGGRIDGLTSWNIGEDFPSLGIGHFIWYPQNAHDKFEESFPAMLSFLQENGVQLPTWLKVDMRCPWNSRAEFLRDFRGNELTEVRTMLVSTVPLQTKFIVHRLECALPKILNSIQPENRDRIKARFYKVLASGSAGTFALIDYVNFKGEGVNEGERYKSQGWGLLQVLEGMSEKGDPVQAFSTSAADVLVRRVQNSPPERHEERWLPGWKKRVFNYTVKLAPEGTATTGAFQAKASRAGANSR